jgi:hypothetical protein
VRDAAFAIAEAARIMQDNLSTLNQQWGVFGTGSQGQLDDLTNLYGFQGKSLEQVQGQFTKVKVGEELTPAQRAMNERVSNWVQAFNRAASATMSEQQTAEEYATKSTGVTYGNSLSFDATSETTSLRMLDVSLSQLQVLRSIDSKVAGAGGVVIQVTVTGTPIVAQTPRQVGTEIAESILPAIDEWQGRKIGTQSRLNGVPTL